MQDLLVVWDALFADSPSFALVDYIFVAMLLYLREACKCSYMYMTSRVAPCTCFVVLEYVHVRVRQ